MKAPAWLAAAILLTSCGEGLPTVSLKLSKNCNQLEVVPIAPAVATGDDEVVLDVAADSGVGDSAWILVRRTEAASEDALVVQRVDASGVVFEQPLPFPDDLWPALSLQADPESGRVWVIRREPGVFELVRIAPDDLARPVLGSDNLIDFPSDSGLCAPVPCDTNSWPRALIFLPNGPLLASMPPFSVNAALVVEVTVLDTDGSLIRRTNEQTLSFEPPCSAEGPEGEAFCQEERESLLYPQITLLGVQQDPRQDQTVLFGHRSRRMVFMDQEFPIDSADVFMVTISLEGQTPAGVLRSYSGFYSGSDGGPVGHSPTPTTQPPFGVAIDRFASYGLFTNGGVVPRLVQLPYDNPDFSELTARSPLSLDTQLLQMDRDLALGHVRDGNWELIKFFPDDPSRSGELTYRTDAPIEEAVSGGVGTFMLEKTDAPPEIVRVRCLEAEIESDLVTTD